MSNFDNSMPDYLSDYFDSEEMRLRKNAFFTEKQRAKYKYSLEERTEFKQKEVQEFWENNVAEIVKSPDGRKTAERDTPPRAEERIEDESELTEEERSILINMCETDLQLFAVRYFPHYLKKPSSKLHKFLYNTLAKEMNNTKRKEGFKWAIAAPRHAAKSSLVSGIFILWCIVYNKKKFIIMISDTLGQAADFLADIKMELETNVKLIADFPNACGQGPTWRIDEIITPNNIKVKALGTGNKIRGRRFGIYRPDLVAMDDLENYEMLISDKQRDKIRYDWFDKEVAHVGGEKDTITDFIVVGTVLGKDSLLNALLDPTEYPDWKNKRFQAVLRFSENNLWDEWEKLLKNRFDADRMKTAKNFFDEHRTEMLANTVVLWPEGDPYYDLMVEKVTRPGSFITEKQNSPVDTTKIYITQDRLHFENFNTNPDFKEMFANRRSRLYYYGAIDPSLGKKSKKGDYSAIITLARDKKTNYILVIDMDIMRRSVDDQIKAIIKAHEKYGYQLFGVETNAFQYVVAENLRKEAAKLGVYVPIKEINQYQDKKMRFEGMLPFLEDGTIVFDSNRLNRSQKYLLGIDQICSFTGENDKHDDAPDGLESAFSLCRAKRFKLLTKPNE